MKQIILVFLLIISNQSLLISQSDIGKSLANAVSLNRNDTLIGSGFYYLHDSTFYLITAAHVLFRQDSIQNITDNLLHKRILLKSYTESDSKNNISIVEISFNRRLRVKKHTRKDICVVEIGKITKTREGDEMSVQISSGVRVIQNVGPLIPSLGQGLELLTL